MRALIADDQEMLREMFNAILSRAQIQVALAHDLESALTEVASSDPFDLILLDYHMPGMDGLNGVQRALSEGKGAQVALMSGNLPHHVVQDALQMGAVGFVPKKLPARNFEKAIRAMATGQKMDLQDSKAIALLDQPMPDPETRLTSREVLLLQHLNGGESIEEVALELGLKQPTLNFTVMTLCRKFQVQDIAEAVAIAKKDGLI
ncbi:response regulator [Marivita sp.]|uniref:response regulator n=1 Tax=Marivita sp. TaxID=2003365 RepID=UPI003F6B5318